MHAVLERETMIRQVNGFTLEVTTADLVSHVRISMQDGTIIVDTDRLSVCGLERLTEVVGKAATIALQNLPGSWRPK